MRNLIAAVLVGLLALGGAATLPTAWKGTTPLLANPEPQAGLTWFWGDRLGRGLVRAIAAAVLGLAGMAVALIAAASGNGDGVVALLGLVLLLAGIVLAAAIVLVNRPKFLVPPPLRDEPGALSRQRRTKSG